MKHIDRKLMPNIGLGPIKLGQPPTKLVRDGFLEFVDGDPDFTDDDHYNDRTGEIRVDLDEDGLIEILTCDGEVWFRDRNLIGLTESQIDQVFGAKPDETGFVEMPDESIQSTRDFDNYGVRLWFENGICVTVSIFEDEPEDD